MLHRSQFTLTSILVATLLVAILLGFYRYWFVVLLVSEFIMVFFGVELLLRKLPAAVKKGVSDNCIRNDGSSSIRRERAERRAVRKLRSEVWFLFLIVLLPLNVLLWLVFQSGQLQQFAVWSAVAWLFIAAMIVRSGYIYFVRQFVIELKLRFQNNLLRDIQFSRLKTNINADKEATNHTNLHEEVR